MIFCMNVGLWTKWAEKYPNIGYLDNRCHGYQKTYSDLTKHTKGCGILSGGTLDGYWCVENRYYEPMLPWEPLSVAMVIKKCLLIQRTLLIVSVATPLTSPSERFKALVLLYIVTPLLYISLWLTTSCVRDRDHAIQPICVSVCNGKMFSKQCTFCHVSIMAADYQEGNPALINHY